MMKVGWKTNIDSVRKEGGKEGRKEGEKIQLGIQAIDRCYALPFSHFLFLCFSLLTRFLYISSFFFIQNIYIQAEKRTRHHRRWQGRAFLFGRSRAISIFCQQIPFPPFQSSVSIRHIDIFPYPIDYISNLRTHQKNDVAAAMFWSTAIQTKDIST